MDVINSLAVEINHTVRMFSISNCMKVEEACRCRSARTVRSRLC